MLIYAISIGLFCFGALLMSALVLAKRKDEVAWYFFMFGLSIAGWGIPGAAWMSGIIEDRQTVLLLMRLCDIGALFIPIIWLQFVLRFIGLRESKYLRWIGYGIPFAIILLGGNNSLFVSGLQVIGNYKYFPTPGPLFHVFTILFLSLVSYSFYHLVTAYRKTKEQSKAQFKYFLIAAAISFFAGSITFLPIYGVNFPIIFIVLMPLYPFFMGIALIRHGLFDTHQILDAFRRDKLAAIGTLATSINHEIRNPLYIIQGLSQSCLANMEEKMYSDKEALEKSKEVLRKTVAQAERAVDIMKRFAMFAKQDIKQKPQIQKVDLNQALNDVLPLLSHELQLDKIRLIQNVPKDLPPLQADPRHLEEILFNLVINACHAMKEKEMEGEIAISAEQQNGHINVLIEDTGPGISADKLKQVFEPFYTTKEQGTGLGLYITKQLVERNGGKISATSKIGSGTTFKLEFKR